MRTAAMPSFNFRTVSEIVVEWSGATRLGAILGARVPPCRLLLVTDSGLMRTGLVDTPRASLEGAGYEITVFDRIVADPPEQVVREAVSAGQAGCCTAVLGLGGGSSLDVAKLAACLIASLQEVSSLYGIGKVTGRRLPLALVPTTAGTGSEVTDIAIVTMGETTKMGVVSPTLLADLVLLDAELTTSLPALHTAATGIDAMVHAIEAYTSRHRKNPMSDALAREALGLLAGNIVTACHDGNDRAAREAMLLGATLAGEAFCNAPVAAVHALAYPLGAHYHIAHGLSNALMLGPVLRFNTGAAATFYAELAGVLRLPERGDDIARAEAFVTAMETLATATGLPRRLRDVGVAEDTLPRLASDAMMQTRLLVNNPVELNEADALALYHAAF